MDITIKEIEKNLKTLPKELFGQVNDYIEFLKYKHFKGKQYEVSEWQKEETQRRVDYFRNNPHSFVSESEMNDYLNDLDRGD